jgi:hypothetical protein
MSVSGPNPEVELADADFRFTPQSRHPAGGLGCPSRVPDADISLLCSNVGYIS